MPGRLDLEIDEKSLNGTSVIRHAILELKVLRSYGSTGKQVTDKYTLEWVEKGVAQAYTYREDRSALASALCCFDMRLNNTGEKCFSHVLDLASRLKVELKLWYIYATSEKYRNDRVNKAP